MFDKIKQLFNRGNNHSLVGRTLRGHYQIIAELHHGGIGETYLAIDLDIPINPKPKFVVKRILPQMKDNPDIIRLFNTEAEILCKLNHNQIPKLKGYFTEKKDFYLVQEYIEGEDLSRHIGNVRYHNTLPTITYNKPEKNKQHKLFKDIPPAPITISRIQWDELMVIHLVKEILEILQYVHQMGVIHRDIKPSNLMRRKCDGKLILIDFGSVKEVATQVINAQGKSAYTMKIGTPGYLPSEQALGRPNFSSDIYAVGMTAIQALTGISPYSLPNEKNEIQWRDFAKVSDQLANFLNKMVRYDCYDRYQNAKEAMQALNRIYMQADTSFLTEQLMPKQDFFSLGYQKLELGDYQGAIADYNSAIELNPNYTIAYNNRGNAYRNLKEYQKAIADYNRAIELNPNYTIAYNNRGNAYRNLKEYQKAIADYNKAIDLNPKDAIAYNNRGNAYRNLKEYQKALSDYNKAI
ncbi:MAG TPA: tetratricopeptide repeat protein, partial [Allocoleopsis sp.]